MTANPTSQDARKAPAGHAFIAGSWRRPHNGATTATVDPATEEPITEVAWCGADDLDDAVQAARVASAAWQRRPWRERAEVLREFAARIRADGERLALVDTVDGGNPLRASRLDVDAAANHLEFFAGLGGRVGGETIPAGAERLTYTERRPYGVVGRILAYNHPLMFAVQGMAAPLVTGNAIILKPADHTPLSALEVASLLQELVPPGLVSVLPGSGPVVGAALARHPGVPRLAFTGSVATGRAVLRAAADAIKHVTLELGGKNPLVVFPDADPDEAARAAVAGMNLTRTAGQSCQSTSRLLVHESIRSDVEAALAARLESIHVGPPTDPRTDMGPLAFKAHHDGVRAAIDRARTAGARLLKGGRRPPGLPRGYYLEPTAFADVTPDMALARDEIFGPVLAVLGWSNEREMLALANDTDFGLTANVVTRDLAAALRTARELEVGMVWVNGPTPRPAGTPFGGVKASGLGRDHGEEELRSYLQEKSVIVAFSATDP